MVVTANPTADTRAKFALDSSMEETEQTWLSSAYIMRMRIGSRAHRPHGGARL